MNVRVWVQAARLRTLPLSFASILLGSCLAGAQGQFCWYILVLALLTTLALQVLSNYANDLGDTLHGADHAGRSGPKRAVQSGQISPAQMRTAVILTSVVAFVLGITLLVVALDTLPQILGFIGLGLACIAGAILYTNGKRPYGYAGLGDVSVLLFFGFVGVIGSFWLYGAEWTPLVVLAALSAGLLATGVLDVNNIRDIHSDKAAGKNSIPVRLGFERAKGYHTVLVGGAILANLIFTGLVPETSPYKYLWLIPTIGLFRHVQTVRKLTSPSEADPLLKQLSLLALATDVALGVGYWLAKTDPAGLSL